MVMLFLFRGESFWKMHVLIDEYKIIKSFCSIWTISLCLIILTAIEFRPILLIYAKKTIYEMMLDDQSKILQYLSLINNSQ